VTQAGIRAILGDWISQTDDELAWATHGVWLSDDEQLRRFLILSLLPAAGMAISEFQDRFPSVAIEAIPGILALMEREWLARVGDRYLLTASGLQNSDTVAPLLYSPTVRERLRSFTESPDLIEAVRQ
jgi:coproporphyrinogen III oxidase-like Fe-S oxidoreductase